VCSTISAPSPASSARVVPCGSNGTGTHDKARAGAAGWSRRTAIPRDIARSGCLETPMNAGRPPGGANVLTDAFPATSDLRRSTLTGAPSNRSGLHRRPMNTGRAGLIVRSGSVTTARPRRGRRSAAARRSSPAATTRAASRRPRPSPTRSSAPCTASIIRCTCSITPNGGDDSSEAGARAHASVLTQWQRGERPRDAHAMSSATARSL